MSKIHRVDQGTAEWHALRIGIPTTSNFHRIITPGGKPSTKARPYLYRLIAEILLNEPMDDGLGRLEWVERGKIEEPNAAAQLEFTRDMQLEPVGFITTDDGRLGCTPDRLVTGKNEAVEIKCPAPWTQIGYMLDGPGEDYKPQVQGQLYVGEFERVHFYSWHPRMPPVYAITTRDEKYIKDMARMLAEFLDDLADETERARRMGSFSAFVRHIERDPMWAV